MAAVPSPAPCLRPLRAVAFDTGGVITDSARSRAAAWEQASDARPPEREAQRPRRASAPSTTAPNCSMSPVRDGLGLPGRPDPALLGEVARSLHVPVPETAVVEDSLAGVEAGRHGGFGLVVAVTGTEGPGGIADRGRRGADDVVSDPGELLSGMDD
ncbi:haloacid dehalogenase superfamily, subfamily IA, variant 3 with third motif having DD or ED [Streptomyces sp. ok210]|nr:HAD family phosphatase [Streptomyces sp. ok210]SFS40989.1 haloacid dehalogenase superfamily, subfamily IA, variant 3 with third motif having DD or ED [Streptomyces sp. ok210]